MHQHFAQKRGLHSLTFKVVDNVLTHMTRADTVIDRIVKPVGILSLGKHFRHMRLAQARHRKQQHMFLRRIAPCLRRFI